MRFRADPFRHAENLYWIGPAKCEGGGTLGDLMNGFERLLHTYPDSGRA